MEIIYGKTLTRDDIININNLSIKCGVSFDTARLLFYRNIDTVEKANRYLHPSKKNFHNPFLFKDMQAVVNRIKLAKERAEKVLVYGDYDADGICASTILYNCLKEYGIEPIVTVPEREDGYGISLDNLLQINDNTPINLVITVDCGISEKEKIESLKSNGIDVIVTDHHEPPEDLPNCLIINPKTKGEIYPFDGLCGAGVAYKVGCALIGEKADKYLDFVAVATIADSMQLVGENRDLVYEGLKLFAPNKIRLAFKYLIGESDKQVTSQVLAYQIAPRINAGGRMGDATSSLKLFISEDANEIFDIAVKLNAYNMQRQTESERVYKETRKIINQTDVIYDPIICVKGEGWNSGVIGIVSSKLVEDYARPVIVFAEQDGKYKGSARSVDGVNIHNLISAVSSSLIGFGGHAQAAGLSIEKENFEDFKKQLNASAKEILGDKFFTKTTYCDWEIKEPISLDFAREISLLEPFGVGNKKPVFSVTVNKTKAMALKQGSPHYSFDTVATTMLHFNGGNDLFKLALPLDKKIMFEVNLSSFRGVESVKGFVKRVIPQFTNLENAELYILRNELLKIKEEAKKVDCIEFDADLIKGGYGTAYCLSDISNLACYNNSSDLKITLFSPQNQSGENCIIVSPSSVGDEFKKVIYLDQPLSYLQTEGNISVVDSLCGYDFALNLETDRPFFATVFSLLCSNVGKLFENSVEAYYEWQTDIDAFSFVFAVEVFLELGLFYQENGYLKRNATLKNALTNSKMYSKIQSIQDFEE